MFKKKGFAIFFVLLFMFIVSGCTSNTPPEAVTDEQGQEQEASATRTYESVKGPVELPLHPERVVVIDQDYVGDVLATGITPIATTGWAFETPYFEERLKDVESIGDKSSFSIEKVIELEPDLILTYNEEQYESLSKIAPTVIIPFGMYADYKERLLEIANVLNREKEAKQFLADFDKKVEDQKKELEPILQNDPRIVILEMTDKDSYLFGDSYGRGGQVIYNELQLNAPQKVVDIAFKDGWASISQETIPEYLGEADFILLGVRDNGVENSKEIMKSKLWQDLPAVKSDHIFEYELNTFYFQDPIALEYQMKEIVDFIKSK
ncbi:ABC transporter substrate-binding protein [Sporosarcina soli]|uniref:ABC transporter substrate-binding protein n=1 Tax=Sporosarcina soli TaxID=334736 RepID=A0ABW0TT12_9BACL